MNCLRVTLVIILGTLCYNSLFSQLKTDEELLLQHANYAANFEQKRKVEYLFKNKNAFVKYNPVSLLFGGALYFYQSAVSKQLGTQCPYEVNCSNFSRICIRKHGLFLIVVAITGITPILEDVVGKTIVRLEVTPT